MNREIIQILPAEEWLGEFLIKKEDEERRNAPSIFKKVVCWAVVSDRGEKIHQHVVGMVTNDDKLECVDTIPGFVGYVSKQYMETKDELIYPNSRDDGSGT